MTRRLKVFIGTVAGCAILVLALWQTLPRWLPGVLSHWLPAGSRLELQGKLHWRQGGLALPGARFTAQDCLLANVGPTRLAYRQGRWQLSSDKVSVDSACLSKLPGGDANSAPLALDQLQRQLPALDLTINDLTLIPWQRYAGKLQISSGPDGQRLHYRGPNLSAEARLDEKQQLTLQSLTVVPPNSA